MIVPMPRIGLQLILLHGYNQLKGVFMQQIDLQVIGSIVDQMAKVINSRKFE